MKAILFLMTFPNTFHGTLQLKPFFFLFRKHNISIIIHHSVRTYFSRVCMLSLSQTVGFHSCGFPRGLGQHFFNLYSKYTNFTHVEARTDICG